MKHNEAAVTPDVDAPIGAHEAEPVAELTESEPVKDAVQVGVKITGATVAQDRFVVCESRDDALSLLRELNDSRSRFVQYNDLLIAVEYAAYAEVVEQ